MPRFEDIWRTETTRIVHVATSVASPYTQSSLLTGDQITGLLAQAGLVKLSPPASNASVLCFVPKDHPATSDQLRITLIGNAGQGRCSLSMLRDAWNNWSTRTESEEIDFQG